MKVTIYGIQHDVKWTYQGNTGSNQRLHVIHTDNPLPAPDDGYRVESIKIKKDFDLSSFQAGDEVNIFYDRYGNVEQIIKVK